MLKLYSGRRLDDEQVQSVVHLVASSVPGSRAVARDRRRSERRLADEPRAATRRRASRARSSITANRSRPTTRSVSRVSSARWSAPIACAPACRPRSISPRPSKRARASIRTCRWFAASRPAKTRAAATACKASPARSAISRRRSPRHPAASTPPPRPRRVSTLALADAQLRARQDRQPYASGRRLDQPLVDRRARRQQAAGHAQRRADSADRAGDRVVDRHRPPGRRLRRGARRHDFRRQFGVPTGRRARGAGGAGVLREPGHLEHRAPSARRRARARARVLRAAPDDAGSDAAAAGRRSVGASVEYAAQMQPMFTPGGRVMALPMGYDDRMAAARSVAGQDPRQVAQVVRNWVAEDNG